METTKNLNELGSLRVESDSHGNIYIIKRPDMYYSGYGTDSYDSEAPISLPKYPYPEYPAEYSEKSLKESLAEAAKQLIDEGEDPENILEEVELAIKDCKKKTSKCSKKQKQNLNLWKNLTK